jgi:hypothetical protein
MKQCFVSFAFSVPALMSKALVFWGGFLRGRENIALVRFANYGVVTDSVVATLMGR